MSKCKECKDPCASPCKNGCVPDCSCPIKVNSSCVFYDGVNLGKLDTVPGDKLTDIIKKINDLIGGEGISDHINIGNGAKIFKQLNLLGEKELRSLISSDNSIIIEEQDKVVDIKAISTNIESSDGSVTVVEEANGFDLSVNTKSIVSSDGSVTISESPTEVDLGVEEVEMSSSNNTISIQKNGSNFDLKIVEDPYTDIPRYIVNNKYTGSVQDGSLRSPFKNIQGAIEAFVGTGTQNNPQNANAFIIVQKGNVYTYNGHLAYRNLNLILEEGAEVNCIPTVAGSWLADYDQLDSTTARLNIELKRGSTLRAYGRGFRNIGSMGGANTPKTINITGSGGRLILVGSRQAGHVLFEANMDNQTGYGMPAHQNFNIEGVSVESVSKDIWNIGINTAVIFNNCDIRHAYKGTAIDPNSKTFYQKGGEIMLNKCNLSINGESRVSCFILRKTGVNACTMFLDRCTLTYPDNIENLFFRESEENPRVDCQYMSTTRNVPLTYVFNTTGGEPWRGVYFNYNVIRGGKIFRTTLSGIHTVDLTNNNINSVTNNVGGVEQTILTRYPDKTSAKAVLGTGSLFIKTDTGDVEITS